MKKVLLLLSNGCESYEASVFADVFGFAKNGGIEVEVTSVGFRKEIECAYGFKILPNKLINDINIDDYDALAIPGGTRDAGFYDEAYSEKFLEVIRYFDKEKKYIAGVCTGAMPIAKSGILEGRRATSYPGKRQVELKEFGVVVEDKDIVIDENIITCSSPSVGLDTAFKLLELLTSKEEANNVREWFGFNLSNIKKT
jgi:4-methyl-5(b-hydroxyethyl)-thiazole monophosphate biosynthesis